MAERVFVTGGTGLIGRALVKRLVGRGDQVVALARSDAAASDLAGLGADVARGDLLDERALAEGLRGVIAVDGAVMAPSIWGKLKTTVQFVAILLAILRPGDPIGGQYADEWVMLIAAFVTVMSAVDYLQRFGPSLTGRD